MAFFLEQHAWHFIYPENFFSTLCIIVVLFVVIPWLHVLQIHRFRSLIIQPGFDGLQALQMKAVGSCIISLKALAG